MMRLMIDGVPHLQATVPDQAVADREVAAAQAQARTTDANDILYSLEASLDYDPEPHLGRIKTKFFALNFSDDEFNPDELGVLQRVIPRLPSARFAVQAGSAGSFGHLTMAHPELWSDHVARFMRDIALPTR
jgi:homoserine O-acetyltransferase